MLVMAARGRTRGRNRRVEDWRDRIFNNRRSTLDLYARENHRYILSPHRGPSEKRFLVPSKTKVTNKFQIVHIGNGKIGLIFIVLLLASSIGDGVKVITKRPPHEYSVVCFGEVSACQSSPPTFGD